MGCSFLDGLVLPSPTGSLHRNVTAVVKPRHSKHQGQDQDSSHEEVLDLLNNQRWQKHQKKFITRRKSRALLTLSLNQPPVDSRAAAGSSPPSPCSWALLELTELFLISEPTVLRNLAPWQQLGTKSLNRPSSHCGQPGPGLPSRSPPVQGSEGLHVPLLVQGGNPIIFLVVPSTSKKSYVTSKLLLPVPSCPASVEDVRSLCAELLCWPSLQWNCSHRSSALTLGSF